MVTTVSTYIWNFILEHPLSVPTTFLFFYGLSVNHFQVFQFVVNAFREYVVDNIRNNRNLNIDNLRNFINHHVNRNPYIPNIDDNVRNRIINDFLDRVHNAQNVQDFPWWVGYLPPNLIHEYFYRHNPFE